MWHCYHLWVNIINVWFKNLSSKWEFGTHPYNLCMQNVKFLWKYVLESATDQKSYQSILDRCNGPESSKFSLSDAITISLLICSPESATFKWTMSYNADQVHVHQHGLVDFNNVPLSMECWLIEYQTIPAKHIINLWKLRQTPMYTA